MYSSQTGEKVQVTICTD